MSSVTTIPEATRYFAELGYGLRFAQDNERVWWVDLVGGTEVIPRYGSGLTKEAAVGWAVARWPAEKDRPTVGGQLRALGMRKGILLQMADEGEIELRCMVEPCYCPGGDSYFDFKLHPPGAWAPTDGHHPKRRMEGGQRTRDNSRLEHTRCNNLDHKRLEKPEKERAAAIAKWLQKYRGGS